MSSSVYVPATGVVVMALHGDVTSEDLAASVDRVVDSLASGGASRLVVDMRKLTSFERLAVLLGQTKLMAQRHRLEEILIVGGPAIDRVAAALQAARLGVPFRVEQDLPATYAAPPRR